MVRREGVGAARRAAVTYRDAMTRPGSGSGPDAGRPRRPPAGWSADPEDTWERIQQLHGEADRPRTGGRHAAPEPPSRARHPAGHDRRPHGVPAEDGLPAGGWSAGRHSPSRTAAAESPATTLRHRAEKAPTTPPPSDSGSAAESPPGARRRDQPPSGAWSSYRSRVVPVDPAPDDGLPGPVNGWHAAESAAPPWPTLRPSRPAADLAGPGNARSGTAEAGGPLSAPLNGWHPTTDPGAPRRPVPLTGGRPLTGRPLTGAVAAAPVHRIDPTSADPADVESTQLLHRYVPAREMLDREDREPPPRRPPTLPEHPPRAVVRRRRARRRLLEWPFLIVFALISAYLLRAYVVQTFYIPSGSMHETLLEGDRVLVNKVSFRLHDVHRGDVVVFRRPPDFPVEDEDLIKRVVALPGEAVEARGRQVYVDGRPLTEPYVEPLCSGTQDFAPVTVPADSLWVMGDNRCNSSDSRVFGPIDQDLLVGRAFVLGWPFARLSWL